MDGGRAERCEAAHQLVAYWVCRMYLVRVLVLGPPRCQHCGFWR
jgi:hypothetical protein